MTYSEKKYQKVNTGKTKYLHMSNTPAVIDICINENIIIKHVIPKDGYSWLGLWMTPTADISKLLLFNFNKKINVTCKFYAWLEMNQDVPFKLV